MKIIAVDQTVDQIFGKITPPAGMNIDSDPNVGFGKLIAFGVNTFIIVASLFLLLYLLWGALDWITSSGEKEKITKAQNKITNAVIGMVLIFVVLVAFNLVAGNLLGIIRPGTSGWEFMIPHL